MKSLLFSLLCVSASLRLASAADITFEWNIPAEPSVDRYVLSYGPSSSSYTNHLTVLGRTNNTATLSLTGTNYVAHRVVTAYGIASDYSDELRIVVPDKSKLRVIGTIQQSADLRTWQNVGEVYADVAPSDRQMFYRTSVALIPIGSNYTAAYLR